MLVELSTTGALRSLGWYSRILKVPCGGCAGVAEYYRRTRKVVLVQKSTIGALGSLDWYSRILKDPYGGCSGTAEYYRSNGEAVLYTRII